MSDSVLNFLVFFYEAGSFIACFGISLAAVCAFPLWGWCVPVVGSWKMLSATVWQVISSSKSLYFGVENFFRRQSWQSETNFKHPVLNL